MDIKCDVLVVGVGPAGSGAAKAAAERGAKTICIDKKSVIGLPVECGEAVGLSLPREFNVNIAPESICMKHEGTVFWANQKVKIDNCSNIWKSMSVNRHVLDKSFAIDAVKSGAKVLVNSELTGAEVDNHIVASVDVLHNRKEISVFPKVVIAADGLNSKMAEIQGRRRFKDIEIGTVASYEMSNLKLSEKNKIQMFFEEMCQMGYGYIIPKSKNTANVGLGSLGIKKTPWKNFEEFLEEHPIVAPQVKNASIIEVKVGQAPISGPLVETVIGNTLFVGDAAGHNLSHVGEGAIPSHICGQIAGSIAAESIKANNISYLENYPLTISRSMGEIFDHCDGIRKKIIQIWTSKLPAEKRFLLGAILVSEIVSPNNFDFIKKLEKLDTIDILNEMSVFLKKQKIKDVKIS